MDDSPLALMHLVTDAAPTLSDPDEPQPRPRQASPEKITARMRKIRELIDQGEYPDLDELAARIVDASATRTT